MIIGIDASRANRKHKTGTEWYSYYLIKCLAQLDSANTYILYTDEPLRGGLTDLVKDECSDINEENNTDIYDRKGFQVIKSPHNNFKGKILKWPYKYFWTQGRLSLEMIFNRPDILFIPAHTLPLIHPKRSIVTVHDIGFEKESRLYDKKNILRKSKKTNLLLNLLVRIFTLGKYGANTFDYLRWSTEFSLINADKIITVSNFTKKDIEIFYKTDSSKIKVVYNGYNDKLYRKIDNKDNIKNVISKYGLDGPYIFYVGRIEKKKNTPALIEAYYNLKIEHPEIRHKLVLVGDASFGFDEIKYLIEEFSLENDIILPGWVKEEDMPYIFNGADAFVFPSIYEGFGIPLLQAMACGIPITASHATSIPEIAGDAALYFDPYNVRSITNSLYKIIVDQELRKRLVENGSDNIANFNWKKCAKETLSIISYQQE